MNATTTKTDAEKIADVAAGHADWGWELYPAYSGRGMFGRTCAGITCPDHAVDEVKAAVRRAGVKVKPATDELGLDMIVYWPGT